MQEWLMSNLVYTGAGATALIWLIIRVMPNETLAKIFTGLAASIVIPLEAAGTVVRGFGIALTGFGRSKVGKKFWEKIEDFIEESVEVCYFAFMKRWRQTFKENLFEYYWFRFKDGLNSDNGVKTIGTIKEKDNGK